LYGRFGLRFLSKSNEAESAAPARVAIFNDNLNWPVSAGRAVSATQRGKTYRFFDCSELFKFGAKRRIIRMPS